MNLHRANMGFTLVELLVVLVITGMTTSLLVTGLGSTWQNFGRLSQKNLTINQGQIPKSWFLTTVNSALLGHPFEKMFWGSRTEFTFTTFGAPNDPMHKPQKIKWSLDNSYEHSYLQLTYRDDGEEETIDIWHFLEEADYEFQYLSNGEWLHSFEPKDGQLPQAIRIQSEDYVWVLATIHRPENADMPPEIPLFGKYEF